MKENRFREIRKASGMTQKVFGEYFKIPKSTIEQWDMGMRKTPEWVLDLIEYKLKNEGII